EGHVPAVFPVKVKQINLVKPCLCRKACTGEPEGVRRRIGEGGLRDAGAVGLQEIRQPPAAAATEINDPRRAKLLAKLLSHPMPQEAMTAQIPEVPVLHLAQHFKPLTVVLV